MRDFLHPEIVLLGVHDPNVAKQVEEFYATIVDAPVYRTSIENAEAIKVAYNTYISMKITFANTWMEICHKIPGTDVDEVTGALALATRSIMSPMYLKGGMGDGGGCHPRDNIALSWLARARPQLRFLRGPDDRARAATEWLAELMETYDPPGEARLMKVILGKSFKSETNTLAVFSANARGQGGQRWPYASRFRRRRVARETHELMSIGIYIDPASPSFLGDRMFQRGRYSSLEGCLGVVKNTLEAQGVSVHTADLMPAPSGSDIHLYVSIGNHANYRALSERPDVVLSAFMVTESPVVEPRIFRGLPQAKHHFKRIFSCIDESEVTYFAGARVDCIPLRWPIDYHGVDLQRWSNSDREFLVMINMNKLPRLTHRELYKERMRAVEFFSRTDDIDLYGFGWDKASRRMGHTWVPWTLRRMHMAFQDWADEIHPHPWMIAARKVYKGELETKWETLARYDFALCFENAELKGWLTEKLFDCLRTGTIPIYWGATDIEKLVPLDCLIDMRQFVDYAELRAFLRALDREAIRRYREAGRAFLESESFEPFSAKRFAAIFEALIKRDAAAQMMI